MSGSDLSKCKLQLHHASRVGNSTCVVKLLDRVAVEAGVNTQVLHLKEETIFESAKWKLALPQDDNSHNRVNFSIPTLEKGMSPIQMRGIENPSICLGCSINANPRSMVSFQCHGLMLIDILQSGSSAGIAITKARLSLVELLFLDPIKWQVEQILSKSSNLCSGCFKGKRCNAKTTKYHCHIVAPRFTRVEKQSKSRKAQ